MSVTESHSGNPTVGTTEYDMPSASTSIGAQTADGIYQLWLDMSALAGSDYFEVAAYEKVRSASTQRKCQRWTVGGPAAQTRPIWLSPPLMLIHGWTYTILKLEGTDRAIPFSIRRMDATIVEDFANSATVSSTEYDLPNNSTTLSSQTADGTIQTFLDLSALVSGDRFTFKVYEKARSGDTQRVAFNSHQEGALGTPNRVLPTFVGMHGWTVTADKESITDRTLEWSIRRVA